jgi:hypothetical protein
MARLAGTSDLVRSCKMENITHFKDTDPITGFVLETVLIDRGNGEFTSMLKNAYDGMQTANEATPK